VLDKFHEMDMDGSGFLDDTDMVLPHEIDAKYMQEAQGHTSSSRSRSRSAWAAPSKPAHARCKHTTRARGYP
jgi:hypothetical protein